MNKATACVLNAMKGFAPSAAQGLADPIRFRRLMLPAILGLCLLESLLFAALSTYYAQSRALAHVALGSAAIFVLILALSRYSLGILPLLIAYGALIDLLFALGANALGETDRLVLVGRYSIYLFILALMAGARIIPALAGMLGFFALTLVMGMPAESLYPAGAPVVPVSHTLFGSLALSCGLVFGAVTLYAEVNRFSLYAARKQKHRDESDDLSQEFVNLAGDMNAVIQGPLEDVKRCLESMRHQQPGEGLERSLVRIRRATIAMHGIARSFGILSQDQRETFIVRINLDELIRYARIVSQANFLGLEVSIHYDPPEEPLEFMGPSGRWLLLLVGLFQFMAEQVQKNQGHHLTIQRQKRNGEWELLLLGTGDAPFDFPSELQQKIKEEPTQELLEQTAGKVFLVLQDRWGLKLVNFSKHLAE